MSVFFLGLSHFFSLKSSHPLTSSSPPCARARPLSLWRLAKGGKGGSSPRSLFFICLFLATVLRSTLPLSLPSSSASSLPLSPSRSLGTYLVTTYISPSFFSSLLFSLFPSLPPARPAHRHTHTHTHTLSLFRPPYTFRLPTLYFFLLLFS